MKFVAVVGPTSSGKSEVALQLAEAVGGEIVCCDSVQLYRGFNIGAAAPTFEDKARVPHHLFGKFLWDEPCDAGVYASEAKDCIESILQRGLVPIVTGGTGLYLRALLGDRWDQDLPKDENLRHALGQESSEELFTRLTQLDPRRASELHLNDRYRVIRALEIVTLSGKPVPKTQAQEASTRDHLVVSLNPERAHLHAAIALRTKKMLAEGLLVEVKNLLDSGVSKDAKPMQSIGYFEAAKYLASEVSEAELFELIAAATRQYAKRQCTWFKKIKYDYQLESPRQLIGIIPTLTADIARIGFRVV